MWRTLLKIRKSFDAFPKVNNGSQRKSAGLSTSNSCPVKSVCAREYSKKYCCGLGTSTKEGNKDHRTRQGGRYFEIKHDWLDAVGWSGVLLLSWYICKPYCCKRVKNNPAELYAHQRLATCYGHEYTSLVYCISKLITESPANYVLPTVRAVKSRKPAATVSERTENLRKGCENLGAAHLQVDAALRNFLGTECMQKQKYDEAFTHFSEAAQANNIAALFNLGICHEMGLGTKQSFQKAAGLYKRASDLGHATAMYNLGVFHVHGWGGVIADNNVARELFTTAAKLGQEDALRALHGKVSSENENVPTQLEEECVFLDHDAPLLTQEVIEPQSNDLTGLWLKVLNIQLNNVEYESTKEPKLSSEDSGVNDLSPSLIEFN